MSRYVVRIELKGEPGWLKYDELHEKLVKAGFERFIEGHRGWYELPNATYVGDMPTKDAAAVVDYLKPVVASVWKKSGLIAFRYEHAAWANLELVA